MAKSANQLTLVPATRANGAAPPRSERRSTKNLEVRMSDDNKTVHVQSDLLIGALSHGTRRDLIDRFFALPALARLHFNVRKGRARLHFEEAMEREEVLEMLAAAMRSRIVQRLPLANEHLLLDDLHEEAIEIYRIGNELSFWRIDMRNPRHYRLWHPLLQSDIVREQVLQEFTMVPDVVRHAPSYIHGSTIHIWVRPHRIEPAHLIEILDPVLANYMAGPAEVAPNRFKEALVNTNLLFAPISDFLFPPLGLINALLVGTINRNHLVPAFRDIRQGRTGLHTLYLCIGTLTLLTFNFFGAAVMYWLLMFWPRKAKQLRQKYEAAFLSRYRLRPRRVWVEEGESVIETRMEELTPESVVVLKEGDIVPGDGLVVSGRAKIDDRLITGVMEDRPREKGERVYASSRLLDGELRIQIVAKNGQSAASRIAAWYGENLKINPEHQSLRAKEYAEAAVLPMLVIGLLGLYRGGMHMAKAAIRPDYLTGPMIAEDFVDLAMTIRAAQDGILLANASSLTALAGCDCLILDDTVDWNARGLDGVRFTETIHAFGIPEVAFLAREGSCSLPKSNFDVVRSGFSAEMTRAFIAQRQHFDHVVAYIGDCQKGDAVASQANLAISVLTPPHFVPHGTQAALLGADLAKILKLLALVKESRAEFNNAFTTSLVPNAASVIGALYFHTHVETSVILSNPRHDGELPSLPVDAPPRRRVISIFSRMNRCACRRSVRRRAEEAIDPLDGVPARCGPYNGHLRHLRLQLGDIALGSIDIVHRQSL